MQIYGLRSPAVSESEIVLSVAYIALIASTFARSVLWLRVALIFASLTFIIFGLLADIRSMVVFNIIIGLLHGVQLVRYLRSRANVSVSEEEDRYRQMIFPGLDDFDFSTLWSMGETVTEQDTQLTCLGVCPEIVWVILDGMVELHAKGRPTECLEAGSMLGEISFLSGGPAVVDTFAVGEVRFQRWDQNRLRTLHELNPNASRAMYQAISQDIGKKLS